MSTIQTQQGDIDLFQTNDDGDIFVQDGLVNMSGGLETCVYLALFGGNEDDQGRDKDPAQWWGNWLETDPAYTYRSELQHLAQSLPLVPSTLLRLQEATKRDLQFLIDNDIANVVEVVATIPRYNWVNLEINIQAVGEEKNFNFVINWNNPPLSRE